MPNSKKNYQQQLYLQHSPELHQFLIRRVGEQEATDLLQETWLHFLKLGDINAVRTPRAFLYKIAANIAIDYGRKAKRSSTFTEVGMAGEAILSPTPAQEAIADGHWQFDRFADALQELPELSRQAFMLNKMDELTHAEIAERLGISQKSVQRIIIKTLNHCIKRLAR